jgi:hypothetical protein
MIHDLPVIPYGGINMYSVCGFEVASAKYSIGCKPALFEMTAFIPQLNDTVECTDYVINPIRTNIVNGTLYRNSFCKRDDINKPSICFGALLRRIWRHDAHSLASILNCHFQWLEVPVECLLC